MNIKENRKKAYKYYNSLIEPKPDELLTSVRKKDIEEQEINLSPSNDDKVILGIIKERTSFFKEDLKEIVKKYNVNEGILYNYLLELMNYLEEYFKNKKIEVEYNFGQDIDLNKIDEIIEYKRPSSEELEEIKEDFLIKSINIKVYEDGEYKSFNAINQKYILNIWKEKSNLSYEEFMELLIMNEVLYNKVPYIYNNEIYYLLYE